MHRISFAGLVTALVWAMLVGLAHADVRTASWNIRNLGWDNGKNYGQLAEVAQYFDLLAIQEVMNESGIETLELAVEEQTGESWDRICSHLVGRGSYKEMYCFLWRDSEVRYVDGAVVYLDDRDVFAREPFSARFEDRETGVIFAAATLHAIYGDSVQERQMEALALEDYWVWLHEVYEATPVMLLGDFNLAPTNPAWQPLMKYAQPLIQEGATTLSTYDGRYANLYDNIWVARDTTLPIKAYGILGFPQAVLEITHEVARATVSDHAPVYVVLGSEGIQASVTQVSVASEKREAPSIVGNSRSGIYHWSGCPGFSKVSEQNSVYFTTREQAEEAGFRAARNC